MIVPDRESRHPETMTDPYEFLAWVNIDVVAAERAMLDGDDGPRRAIWSTQEPVSALGAWRTAVGRTQLVEEFEVLASTFSSCLAYEFDLLSYDVTDDFAYTTGYERIETSVDGVPRSFTLRSTQVYRHEADGWKIVHRHADILS